MQTALFIPCYMEALRPEAGLATARLLDHLNLDWVYPKKQSCCGQPIHNAGFEDLTLSAARHFLRCFGEAEAVIAPSASCISMIRRYPAVPGLRAKEIPLLESLGKRSFELSEYLVQQLGLSDLGARYEARVCYQEGCQALRELGLKDEALQLLRSVQGLELLVQEGQDCCGFGGLFSARMPEVSLALADRRLDAMREVDCDTLVLGDLSCLLHLESRALYRKIPFRGLHLAEVLAGGLE
ncbi:MAG: (Fe-S)-binding protein [Candidatus Krumholzibacteria bacterium]|jgi:L-lactate dehydrogenase complex protein LldE|nr:(Fe-S)-binding protein [Candidatus Krumholzibacteria bacterium]MDP6668474.1 (Fe-S)-binding protein [Candidatus Krumholzibacteria bacterium]MDP6797368.1 (Fe-S)-binding protein [Candidatus Krumholzibacteria bacterium]MDP7021567.1 (Fe-S)-binding protein [Candidatus Krumholzibacteria bacterium]